MCGDIGPFSQSVIGHTKNLLAEAGLVVVLLLHLDDHHLLILSLLLVALLVVVVVALVGRVVVGVLLFINVSFVWCGWGQVSFVWCGWGLVIFHPHTRARQSRYPINRATHLLLLLAVALVLVLVVGGLTIALGALSIW